MYEFSVLPHAQLQEEHCKIVGAFDLLSKLHDARVRGVLANGCLPPGS